MHRSRNYLATIIIFVAGCVDVPATNPFDPDTPTAQRQMGSMVGQVVTPDEYPLSAYASAIQIQLYDIDGDTPRESSNPDAEGQFTFGDLQTERYYEVRVASPTFQSQTLTRFVGIGEHIPLGRILLEPRIEVPGAPDAGAEVPPWPRIIGRAQLAGVANETAHGDIVIEVVNSPINAITNSDGRFTLSVPPGNWDLQLRKPGYAPQAFGPILVGLGDVHDIEDTIILQGQPGAIGGRVALREFETAERLQGVDVSLFVRGGNLDLVSNESPDAEGRFFFEEVGAGDYRLSIKGQGYDQVDIDFSVAVSQVIRLGTILLDHQSRGTSAVPFTGQVLLNDEALPLAGGDHGGTSVQLIFGGRGQDFQRTSTDASGTFSVLASPEEQYRVLVERPPYVAPTPDEIGLFSWDAAEEQFRDSDGHSLNVEIFRAPLNGNISVSVAVSPSWVPEEQRTVRVSIQQLDGEFQDVREGVTPITAAVFEGVPAGLFRVEVTKPGFTTWKTLVQLDELNSDWSTDDEPAAIWLENLGSAELDLDGRLLTACQLRESPLQRNISLLGGDFSGATLIGRFGAMVNEPDCGCGNPAPTLRYNCESLVMRNGDFTGSRFARIVEGEGPVYADLSNVDFRRATFFGAHVAGVDLTGAQLTGANLFGLNGENAIFTRANLDGANLTSANLRGAVFSPASDERYDCLDLDGDGQPDDANQDGVCDPHPWDGWRIALDSLPHAPCRTPNPNAASLINANFAQANLGESFMVGADLHLAILSDAAVVGADLRSVCLENSVLNLIDLSDALLDGADLTGAQMINAIMSRTVARGTTFQDAALPSAVIEGANLSFRTTRQPNDPCASLLDWSEYNQGGACEIGVRGSRPERCECRTDFRNANLNGANLIGTDLEGADFFGASLINLAVGESLETPDRKPPLCQPQKVSDAIVFYCETLPNCMADQVRLTPEELEQQCSTQTQNALNRRVPIDSKMTRNYATCLTRALADIEDCQTIDFIRIDAPCKAYAYDEGPAPFDESVAQTPLCSWQEMRRTLHLPEGEECEPGDNEAACCPAHLIPTSCTRPQTNFNDVRFDSAELTGVSLQGISLENATLIGSNFRDATLNNSNLSGANLTDASLDRASLISANLSDVDDMRGASFVSSDLTGASLYASNLTAAFFSNSSLRNTDMQRTQVAFSENLNQPSFTATGTDFSNAQVETISWHRANLAGSTLPTGLSSMGCKGCNLGRTQVIGGRIQGADLRNYDDENVTSTCDMEFLNVALDVDASGTSFCAHVRSDRRGDEEARISVSGNFSGSNMNGSLFENVNVRDANFDNSSLTVVRHDIPPSFGFTDTTLEGSSFRHSTLASGLFLENCTVDAINVNGADFSGARFDEVRWIRGYFNADFMDDWTCADCRFSDVVLTVSDGFSGFDFSGANLTDVSIRFDEEGFANNPVSLANGDLSNAHFEDVHLGNATIENTCARDITSQGLRAATFSQVDLSRANLRGLESISFQGTVLDAAFLAGAEAISFAPLPLDDGQLMGVSIDDTYLGGVDFRGQDLTGVVDWDVLGQFSLFSGTLGPALFDGAQLCMTAQNSAVLSNHLRVYDQTPTYRIDCPPLVSPGEVVADFCPENE